MAVAESMVGLRRAATGSVLIDGSAPRPGSVPAALRAGAGFVPQDRHREGLVPELSLAENVTMTVPERLGSLGLLRPRRRAAPGTTAIHGPSIKAPRPPPPGSALCAGNQQDGVMAPAPPR